VTYKVNRVLIVGLGSIGRRHLEVLNSIYPGVQISALRHDHCSAKESEELGLFACFTKIEDAIKFKPQFAIIANPSSKHIEISKALARAGIHLLIEKPIASESRHVQELIDFCHDKKIVLMTAYNLRFSPSLQHFRKLVLDKIIGNIFSIHTEVGQYLPNWRLGNNYQNNVSSKKKLGGGVLRELSHELDYLMWIFGPISWVKSKISKQSNLKIDVEDTAKIIFGLNSNTGNQISAMLCMDFIRHDTTRKCSVIGEKGTLLWDGALGEVSFYSALNKSWDTTYSKPNENNYMYEEEIKNFVSSIELSCAPAVTGEDGLAVLLVIEAVTESSNLENVVYL